MVQFLPLVQQHVFPTLRRTGLYSQYSVNLGSTRGYPQKQGVGKDYLGAWLSIHLFGGVSARCGVRRSLKWVRSESVYQWCRLCSTCEGHNSTQLCYERATGHVPIGSHTVASVK